MSLQESAMEPQLIDEADQLNQQWGIDPKHASSQKSPDPPPQLAKASQTIGRQLQAIQEGTMPTGTWPAVERIVNNSRPYRRRRGTRTGPPTAGPAYPSRLITDVTPTIRERVAVVEHITADLKEKFEDHRHESIRAAERAESTFATKTEVLTLQSELERLAGRSTWKTIAIIITTSGTVIAIVWYAVQLGSKLHIG